jgi:hypothetical protein
VAQDGFDAVLGDRDAGSFAQLGENRKWVLPEIRVLEVKQRQIHGEVHFCFLSLAPNVTARWKNRAPQELPYLDQS